MSEATPLRKSAPSRGPRSASEIQDLFIRARGEHTAIKELSAAIAKLRDVHQARQDLAALPPDEVAAALSSRTARVNEGGTS